MSATPLRFALFLVLLLPGLHAETLQLTADTADIYGLQDVELLQEDGLAGQKDFSILTGVPLARWYTPEPLEQRQRFTEDAEVTLTFSAAVQVLADIDVVLYRVSEAGALTPIASDSQQELLTVLPSAFTFTLALADAVVPAGDGLALEVSVAGLPVLATLDYGGGAAQITYNTEVVDDGGFSFSDITNIDSDLQPLIATGLILAAFAIAGVALLSRFP